MKNIHVLPTDKPSRLSIRDIDNKLCIHRPEVVYHGINQRGINQNIYITSDREIKEGDWVFDIFKNAYPVIRQLTTKEEVLGVQKTELKIILTTNVDLIEDGVQAIDDEFLEWFVKNPNCEEVEVKPLLSNNGRALFGYKIVITKEEPKYPIGGYAPGYYSCTCVTCKVEFMGDKRAVQCEPCAISMTKEEPKQETTSEGFHRISKEFDYSEFDFVSFKIGTEWQQEQFSKSEFIQLVRATKSDAEARRIIREYFK